MIKVAIQSNVEVMVKVSEKVLVPSVAVIVIVATYVIAKESRFVKSTDIAVPETEM